MYMYVYMCMCMYMYIYMFMTSNHVARFPDVPCPFSVTGECRSSSILDIVWSVGQLFEHA